VVVSAVTTTKIIERGDIFASPCRVLVNPVNCVGVSGKGLAKEFKRRFPLSVKAYEKDCRSDNQGIWPGAPQDYEIIEHGKIVLFFATKIHWKDPSEMQFIDDGLCELVAMCATWAADRYPSIAIPALGCGLGQLSWSTVLPLIQDSAARLNECGVSVEIYAPLEGT
jgi:O-acetyl-ADP-ribose deacetylase (regulator of RNase III)